MSATCPFLSISTAACLGRRQRPGQARRASSRRLTRHAATDLENICIPRDLPLLPADVGIPHHPLPVDDEEPRPLAQGVNFALHLVAVIDRVRWVNQAGEGDNVLLEVGPRMLSGVFEDGDDLRACTGERLVLLRQLTEVPAAEGSREATQEYQDNASLPTVMTERDVSCRCGWQREVWRHGADSYSPTGSRHIWCLPSL